jgi:hypothetical protein
MGDAHAKECRTREAESLEQAKHANHEDLKHLYETIAQQWGHLAEVIETGRASTQPPIASAPDIPAPGAKTDATPDTPDALRIERPEGTNYGSAQVSSSAEEMQLPDQISANDQGVVKVSPDAEDRETLDHQIFDNGQDGAQISAGARAAPSLDNRISEIDRGTAINLDLEGLGDQTAEANHGDAEVRPSLAGVENLDDQISETDHSAVQVSAESASIDVETDLCAADPGTERLKSPDEQIVESMQDAGQVSSGTERLESADDRTSKTDQGTAQVGPGVGGIASLDDQSSQTDCTAAQISPGPKSIKSTDDEISENDRGPSTGRVQTPLEWMLWFRSGRR